jgi:hypothetical protein
VDAPVFIGRFSQRGYGFGSILSGLVRNIILPTIKSLGKSIVKTAGKSFKRQAIKAASGLAEDVLVKRRKLKDSLGKRGRELAANLTQEILEQQRGRGKRKRSQAEPDIFTKRRRVTDVFVEN